MTTPAEKFQKLMALANDQAATPAEAATARRLADELAARHGLRQEPARPRSWWRLEPIRYPRQARPQGDLGDFFAANIARELGVLN